MAKFDKDDLREAGRLAAEATKNTEAMQKNVSGYLTGMKAIGQEQLRLEASRKRVIELDKAALLLQDQITAKAVEVLNASGAAKGVAELEQRALEAKLTVNNSVALSIQKQIALSEVQLELLAQQANEVNGMALAYNQMGQVWNRLPGLAKKFYGYISSMQALEMSKEIKKAELSMGILGNQSKFFGKNMANASTSTQALGVSVSDLAIAQRGYADEIGRGVVLSEAELVAMAEIGKGTMLGMDGAVGMAAAMENFGLNATSARDGVQETVDIAHKMGVNANSAIKELGKTLKLAQRYHFKGGVKGMASMASYAAGMKMDMSGVASMADKAFRPEGAIEMAARLATMGGSMAKLGDPFTLMFKARNDFEGFAKDVGSATAEFSQFNKKTGEFDITGLQLDRIKEIADITGLGAENVAEMSKQAAKFNMAKSMVNFEVKEEDREMIANMANYDKDSGQWMVQFDGKKQLLKDMDANGLKQYRLEQKSLKERAEQSQTFDEAFTNITMQFKTMALPFITALNDGLVKPMIKFQEQMKNTEFLDTIRDLGASLGRFIGAVGGFVLEFPKISLAIAAGGTIFFKAGQWIANGRMLGIGFNSVAGGKGGSGMGGIMDMLPGGKGMRVGSKMMKGGKMMKGASTMLKGAGKFAAPLALASMGMDAYTNSQDDSLSTGQSIFKTLDQNKLAILGGIVGAVTGGPAGAMAGYGLGGMGDMALNGLAGDDALVGHHTGDYNMDDGMIKFNPQDKFLKMDDGIVASTSKGKIDDIAKTSKDGGKIEFGELKIKGNVTVDIPNGNNMNIDLTKDPFFIREITRLIQEQLRTDIGGGKLSPNPI